MPKKDRDIITAELGVEPVMFDASLVSAQSRKRLFWTNIKFDLPTDRGIVLKDILQEDAEVDESMVTKGKAYCLTARYFTGGEGQWEYENNKARKQRTMVKVGHIGKTDGQANRVYSPEGKSCTLSANGGGSGAKTGLYEISREVAQTMVRVGHIGAGWQGNRVYSPDGKSATLSANSGGLGSKTGLYEIEHTIRKLTPVECERLQGLPDGYTEGIAKTHRYKCLGNAFNVDVIAHILNHHPNSHTRPQSSP